MYPQNCHFLCGLKQPCGQYTTYLQENKCASLCIHLAGLSLPLQVSRDEKKYLFAFAFFSATESRLGCGSFRSGGDMDGERQGRAGKRERCCQHVSPSSCNRSNRVQVP